jgi:hypothetical protein
MRKKAKENMNSNTANKKKDLLMTDIDGLRS